jgi:broad specificity phosphatase PhoE
MAICLARHGAREDYAYKSRGENWQLTHDERPWDPPLTAGGVQQGLALGVGLQAHCQRLGLPPVTRVLSSPLLRCVQTAAAAAKRLGVSTVSLEPGLAEGMLEEWYRSWGVPGADSTWGGPSSSPCGTPVDLDRLHAACHVAAGTLLLQPAEAAKALEVSQPELAEAVRIDREYSVLEPQAEYRWPMFETEALLAARIKRTLKALGARYPGESILACSHGGPSVHAYRELLGARAKEGLLAGYTALFIFVRGEDGQFDAPVAADQSHLEVVVEVGLPYVGEPLAGPNDLREQE